MAELIIRQAEEKDILQSAEIEKQCFTVPWSYESLCYDILENNLSFYIVAEIEGKVCGYVGIWNIVDEGHINNVAVAPAYRRKHIGSALLDVLIGTCEAEGILRLTLEVRAGNTPARRLYEQKGFLEAGLRKGYYEDNHEDAVIMWRGSAAASGEAEEGAEEQDTI